MSPPDIDAGRPRAARSNVAGVVSIVLAICGAACAVAGYFTLWFPVLGALLSFAGPLFASAAIVGGSIAVRRDRSQPTRTWGGTTGRIGRLLGVVVLPPTLGIALTCGIVNAAGTAYLHRRHEERAAELRADEARGRDFWRPARGDAPWVTPEMPWQLRDGERESELQRNIRHAIELALELVRLAEETEGDVRDAEAGPDAGMAP